MDVMTVLARFTPRAVKNLREFIAGNEYGNRFMTDMVFRATVSQYRSLIINLLFAAFKLITAVMYSSFWFGAVAVYYIMLCGFRIYLLRHMRAADDSPLRALKIYRRSGILLLILNIALTGIVYQIIFAGQGYQYPGLMIYAFATYAFYCLTSSIIGIIKYRKNENPLLKIAKAVNFTTALVAVFSLQTGMFAEFGTEMEYPMTLVMNTATGCAICIVTLVMGVIIITDANKRTNELAERTRRA